MTKPAVQWYDHLKERPTCDPPPEVVQALAAAREEMVAAERALAPAAARAEANTVADVFLNTPLFGAPLSGAPPAAGPRFKAYVQQQPAALGGGDLLMTDTAPAAGGLPFHPGTVNMWIEMRCDDVLTMDVGSAADHALFAERVIRFFDYIGPNVAPAKIHRWTVGFGWSGQRT